jgi:hypothetical protein
MNNAVGLAYFNPSNKDITIAIYELMNIIGDNKGKRMPKEKITSLPKRLTADHIPLHTM